MIKIDMARLCGYEQCHEYTHTSKNLRTEVVPRIPPVLCLCVLLDGFLICERTNGPNRPEQAQADVPTFFSVEVSDEYVARRLR